MRELCSSGYIERSVMMLQGLEGAEEFSVTISEKKRLFAAVAAKLSDAMSKAPENVQLGSCDEKHQKEYIAYLVAKMNDILPSLAHFRGEKDEGEDSLEKYLVDILEDYSSVGGWSYDSTTSRVSFQQ